MSQSLANCLAEYACALRFEDLPTPGLFPSHCDIVVKRALGPPWTARVLSLAPVGNRPRTPTARRFTQNHDASRAVTRNTLGTALHPRRAMTENGPCVVYALT